MIPAAILLVLVLAAVLYFTRPEPRTTFYSDAHPYDWTARLVLWFASPEVRYLRSQLDAERKFNVALLERIAVLELLAEAPEMRRTLERIGMIKVSP
jgi:hypothetical protein